MRDKRRGARKQGKATWIETQGEAKLNNDLGPFFSPGIGGTYFSPSGSAFAFFSFFDLESAEGALLVLLDFASALALNYI